MKGEKNKKKFKKDFSKKSGYISVHLLMAVSITVTLLTGLVVFAVSAQKKSLNEIAKNKSLQIAEYGIYYYKWYLAHNLDGRNVQQIKEFWQDEENPPLGIDSPYIYRVKDSSEREIGQYQIEVASYDPNSTIVVIESTGKLDAYPQIEKKIRVRFRRPSWSEYSVLANDVMRFGAGTNVYGPIHSNNGIRFDGTANNIITSAVETYLDPDTGTIKPGVWTSQADEDQVFLAGKEYPVPSVDFNGVAVDLAFMKNEAQDFGEGSYFGYNQTPEEVCRNVCILQFLSFCLRVEYQCGIAEVKGYHLILGENNFIIRDVLDYHGSYYNIISEGPSKTYNYPENGLLFFEKPTWVEGQIDGQKITIASANLTGSGSDSDIYIEKDVRYTNYDGTNIIGLIAQNNISIGYYSNNILRIDGALLAQKGRVGRNQYSGTYRNRNTITLFGSMATNKRYGFAYTDGTGYQIRNLYFDNNLLYYPPPYFPTGNVYRLDLWEDM